MGKTLVLGATGHLAGLTADILHRSAPEDLRVATSRERKFERLRQRFPGAEVVIADWNEESSLVNAMDGVTTLLVVTPDMTTDESVVTPNIIAAAKEVGSIELIVRLIAMTRGLTIDDLSKEFLTTRIGAAQHVIAKPQLDASGLPVAYCNVPAWIAFNLPTFLATDVKPRRRLSMPASTDAARMWVTEGDVAEVLAHLLTDAAADHVGKEYLLTSPTRLRYKDIAAIFSEVLGETVTYHDDDEPLRAAMGPGFDTLMTYFLHERGAYADVEHEETITEILGRPAETLRDYISTHRELFQ